MVKILLTALELAAATAAAFWLLRLGAELDGWLPGAVEDWGRSNLPALRIQRYEVLSSVRLATALGLAAGFFLTAARLVLAFAWFLAVLALVPATRPEANRFFLMLLSAAGGMLGAAGRFVPNAVFIVVVAAVVHYASRFLHALFRQVGYGNVVIPGFYPDWAEPTYQIVRVMLWALTLVVVFPYLPGAGSEAFKGVSVFMGVLLSLGSGSAVSNAVAGTILTYMRPFKHGDRVRIADTTGDVVERTLLVTRVRTVKNEDVTIPNSMVLGAHIVNYSSSAEDKGLILHTEVTIGYDAPWRKVHALLIAAARGSEGVLQEPEPFILQRDLGDYSVRYELNAYTDRPHKMASLYSRLHENIQDRFAEAGVEIMSPMFVVRRTGPESTVPSSGKP
ncbi:MAG: mechanosensitive ion channel family protein [Elusimicrobia bacterium]|nr:mechanosensitive ion channel family protein [Elusimicrobiota bacterium]